MIEDLLLRVYEKCIPGEGGCMNWTGGVQSKAKNPAMRKDKPHCTSIRRWMLEEQKGKAIARNRVATYVCGNPRCVKLEHLIEMSRRELQLRTDSQLDAAQRLQKGKRVSNEKRKNSKLTPEMAKEIAESTGPQRAVGRQYGVSQSTVARIRRGVVWKPYNASHWDALLAA